MRTAQSGAATVLTSSRMAMSLRLDPISSEVDIGVSLGYLPHEVQHPMRPFSQKGLAAPGAAHELARARASDSRMSFGSVGVAPALVQSNAVRELLSDDGGVNGGTLEHRHRDRGDGAAPVGLELLVPRRRTFVDGTND